MITKFIILSHKSYGGIKYSTILISVDCIVCGRIRGNVHVKLKAFRRIGVCCNGCGSVLGFKYV